MDKPVVNGVGVEVEVELVISKLFKEVFPPRQAHSAGCSKFSGLLLASLPPPLPPHLLRNLYSSRLLCAPLSERRCVPLRRKIHRPISCTHRSFLHPAQPQACAAENSTLNVKTSGTYTGPPYSLTAIAHPYAPRCQSPHMPPIRRPTAPGGLHPSN